jgi:hypothetical protein
MARKERRATGERGVSKVKGIIGFIIVILGLLVFVFLPPISLILFGVSSILAYVQDKKRSFKLNKAGMILSWIGIFLVAVWFAYLYILFGVLLSGGTI